MSKDTRRSEAGRDYALAQDARYGDKDLLGALTRYVRLLAEHPDSPEAEFSRTQIDNIVNHVVPRSELSSVHVGLALAKLEARGVGGARRGSLPAGRA